jgi:hypothetical protein
MASPASPTLPATVVIGPSSENMGELIANCGLVIFDPTAVTAERYPCEPVGSPFHVQPLPVTEATTTADVLRAIKADGLQPANAAHLLLYVRYLRANGLPLPGDMLVALLPVYRSDANGADCLVMVDNVFGGRLTSAQRDFNWRPETFFLARRS